MHVYEKFFLLMSLGDIGEKEKVELIRMPKNNRGLRCRLRIGSN